MSAKHQLTRFWIFSLLVLLGSTAAPRPAMAAPKYAISFTVNPPTTVSADQTYSVTAHVQTIIGGVGVAGQMVTLAVGNAGGTAVTATPVQTTSANPGTTGLTGDVSFSNVKIATVGSYTLAVSVPDPGPPAVTDTAFSTGTTVTVGAPSGLTFTTAGQPTDTIAGSTIQANGGSAVQVTLKDAESNPISGKTISVRSSGPALTGTLTGSTNAAGVASFSTLVINTASTGVSLFASIGSVLTQSDPFDVTAGVVANLAISQQPSPVSVSADSTFSFSVTATDPHSNPVGGATVTLSLASGPAGATLTPISATTGNGTAGTTLGVATVVLNVNKVGTYTLQAKVGAVTLPAASNPVTITAGLPNAITITAQPSAAPPATPASVPADNSFTVSVTVKDAEGNAVADGSTVSLTSSPSVTISGSTTTTTGGSATFTAQITSPGTYTLTVHSGTASQALNPLTVMAGTVSRIVISQQPTTSPATNPTTITADSTSTFSLKAKATDAAGNAVAGVPITLSLSSNPAALSGGGSTNTNSNGVAAFATLNVKQVGTYTLTAVSGSVASAPSSTVTVTAGAVGTGTVTILSGPTPASVASGNAFSLSVRALDAQGNPIDDGSTVTLALYDSTGMTVSVVPLSSNSATTTGGVATFNNLSIATTGQYTIKATATTGTTSKTSAASGIVTVTPGDGILVSTPTAPTPTPVLAGNTFTVKVMVTDNSASHNPIAGAAVSLSLASAPSGATLTGGSATTADGTGGTTAGVATFTLSVDQVGSYTLKATSGSMTSSAGASFSVGLNSLAAAFSSQPSPSLVTATNPFSAAVVVQDSSGNPAPNGTPVTLTLLNADGTATTATLSNPTATTVSGKANFTTLSINKVGAYVLTPTSPAVPATPAPNPSSQIAVTTGPAATLSFSAPGAQPPTTVSADNTFPIKVQVLDAGGNAVADGTLVTLAFPVDAGSTPVQADGTTPIPAGTLLSGGSANTTGGVATFTLNVNKAGTYVLIATSGAATSISSAVQVTLGQLITTITQQPTPATVATSQNFSLVVRLADKNGNLAPDSTAITLALLQSDGVTAVPAGTTLTDQSQTPSVTPPTATTAGGVAAFPALNVNKVGAYTLSVSAAPAGLAAPMTVVSAPVQVILGPAVVTIGQPTTTPATSPATVSADNTFRLTVGVTDANGNPVPDNTPVTLSLFLPDGTPAPAGTVLTGGTGNTTGGSAAFTLKINKVGTYVLTASSGGATSGLSGSITLTPGAPAQAAFPVQPGATASGATLTPAVVVSITDSSGNPVPGTGVSLTLSGVATAGGKATLTGGGAQTTDANGRATFSNLSVDKVGSYTLVAAVAGAPSVSNGSNAFTVGAGGARGVTFGQTPAGVSVANASAGSPLFTDPTTTPPTPITVSVVDAAGNPVPGAGVSLGVSGTPTAGGVATLRGATSQTTNSSGVATFSNLSVDKVGSYTLVAAVAGAPTVNSNKFSVTAVTAAAVAFFNIPIADAAPDAPITTTAKDSSKKPVPVTVTVTDSQGNIVPGATVGLSLAAGNTGHLVTLDSSGKPAVAPLATVITDANGQATFQNFGIDTPGTKQLVATAIGLDKSTASGQSTPFNVGNLMPVIISLDSGGPIHAGDPIFTLKINGDHFVPGTTVKIAGQPLTSGVTINSEILITVVPSNTQVSSLGLTQAAGTVPVIVANPASGTVPAPAAVTGLLPIYPLGPQEAADAGGNVQHFAAGLQLFSVPYDYRGSAVEDVLTGFQVSAQNVTAATVDTANVVQEAIQPTLAVWDPALNSYLITPALDKNFANLNADQLALGQGYWGRFTYQPTGDPTRETGLLQLGTTAQNLKDVKGNPLFTAQGQFQIALQPGWNMIGDPFPSQAGVLLADVLVQPAGGGTTLGLPDANDQGYVNQTFYKYDTGKNAYVPVQTAAATGVDNVLRPYVGYWVRAYQPCTLLVPAPAQ